MDQEISDHIRSVFVEFLTASITRQDGLAHKSEKEIKQSEEQQLKNLALLLCFKDDLDKVLAFAELALVESVAQRFRWTFVEDSYPDGIEEEKTPQMINWKMSAEQAEFFEELEESAVRQASLLQP